MNTYKVKTNRVFKYVAVKNWTSVLLFLTLVAYQSVSVSEPASMTNILGMSLLSPSEELEEGFFERFSSGAFPGQPPLKENKNPPSVQVSKSIFPYESAFEIKIIDKKSELSSLFSLLDTSENGMILGKYDSVIERVNKRYSGSDKTSVADVSKETTANKNKLDLLIAYDGNTDENTPISPSRDIHNEPADFGIGLSETGIVVRYLW